MTLLLVRAWAVIPAAASPELRQGESRGRTRASRPLARRLCVSRGGREGLSDTVIKPGSCVGGTEAHFE